MRNAYDFLQRDQCFATGGYGPDEQLLPPDQLRERLGETHNTFETQCGAWAAFKLAKYLVCFTGDARYGDWIERLVLNGIGASLPMTRDGRVFYYSDYCLYGGTKRLTDFGWSCCTGTRPQAVADYADLVYFHDADTLHVNLFTPSTVKWTVHGKVVTVAQTTTFPETDEVRFVVSLEDPVEFGINVRVPGWLAAPMVASVNGSAADLRFDGRHWAGLRRTWRNGDVILAKLPMKLWRSSFDPRHSRPAAAMYGPIVLAFEAPDAQALSHVELKAPERELTPEPGHPLHFHLTSNPAVTARPFSSLGPGRRYFVYLDPRIGTRVPHMDLKLQGRWGNAGVFRYSNEVGATAEGVFEGTGVRWLGKRFNDAGSAEVTIDGRPVAVVDQYGPGRDLPFDWTLRGLAPGRHTIRLRILPEKPGPSTDRFINVAGFEALTESGR